MFYSNEQRVATKAKKTYSRYDGQRRKLRRHNCSSQRRQTRTPRVVLRRKLSSAESSRLPQLPIPQPISNFCRYIVLLWRDVSSYFENVWKTVYILLYCKWLAYRFTEEDESHLLEWVRSKAFGYAVTNFASSWKNGIALVALLEGILPKACSSCSQYHLLNPKDRVNNVELGLTMARKYLNVNPILTASDIATAAKPRQLIRFILLLKLSSEHNKKLLEKSNDDNMKTPYELRRSQWPAVTMQQTIVEDPIFGNQPCLIKGMGLMVGVRGRRARFNIHLQQSDFFNIVIEINGNNGEFCSRLITERSSRKVHIHDESLRREMFSPDHEDYDLSPKLMTIPLAYEMKGRVIEVSYIPKSSGKLELAVFWNGRHIQESPYTVKVDEDTVKNTVIRKRALPRPSLYFASPERSKYVPHTLEQKQIGSVIRKRVIRSVVIRCGKEIELRDDEPLPPDPTAWCGPNGLSWDIGDCIIEKNKSPIRATSRPFRPLVKDNSIDDPTNDGANNYFANFTTNFNVEETFDSERVKNNLETVPLTKLETYLEESSLKEAAAQTLDNSYEMDTAGCLNATRTIERADVSTSPMRWSPITPHKQSKREGNSDGIDSKNRDVTKSTDRKATTKSADRNESPLQRNTSLAKRADSFPDINSEYPSPEKVRRMLPEHEDMNSLLDEYAEELDNNTAVLSLLMDSDTSSTVDFGEESLSYVSYSEYSLNSSGEIRFMSDDGTWMVSRGTQTIETVFHLENNPDFYLLECDDLCTNF